MVDLAMGIFSAKTRILLLVTMNFDFREALGRRALDLSDSRKIARLNESYAWKEPVQEDRLAKRESGSK